MTNSFLTPWEYQYDPTATSADNKIEGEEHNLPNADHLPFPVNEGLFYVDSVVVYKQGNATPLTLGTDYKFDGFDSYITAMTGHETAAVINILDKNSTGTFIVDYQAVGGAEGQPMGMVKKLLEAITLASSGQVDFRTDITGLPTYYPPEPHQHPLESMEQLDLLAQVFRETHNALITRRPMKDSTMGVNQQLDRLLGIIGDLRNSINHVAAIQGSAGQISDIVDKVNNIEMVIDAERTMTSGQTFLVGEYDLTSISSVRGFLVFDGTTASESVDFSIICRPGQSPKVLYFGRNNTAGLETLTVQASRVGDTLRVLVAPSQDGTVRARILSVL